MGRPPAKEQKYVDIYREKPIKVTVKVLVPVREHPKVILNSNHYSLPRSIDKEVKNHRHKNFSESMGIHQQI